MPWHTLSWAGWAMWYPNNWIMYFIKITITASVQQSVRLESLQHLREIPIHPCQLAIAELLDCLSDLSQGDRQGFTWVSQVFWLFLSTEAFWSGNNLRISEVKVSSSLLKTTWARTYLPILSLLTVWQNSNEDDQRYFFKSSSNIYPFTLDSVLTSAHMAVSLHARTGHNSTHLCHRGFEFGPSGFKVPNLPWHAVEDLVNRRLSHAQQLSYRDTHIILQWKLHNSGVEPGPTSWHPHVPSASHTGQLRKGEKPAL